LGKATEVDPKNTLAHNRLGRALHGQRKLDEAISAYRKAIELDPKNANLHNILDIALKQQNKLSEAIAACRKAIELDPKDADAHYSLGLALWAQKKFDEAVTAFSKAVEINPERIAVIDARLRQFSFHAEFAAVRNREDFKKIIAAARPLNRRAFKIATDPDSELVMLAEEAVAAAPKDANCWNTLGIARYRAGDFNGAIAALQQFRELRIHDTEFSNPFFLAMAHWKLGHADEARRWRGTAIAWMEANAANVKSLRRYRAEMDIVMQENGVPNSSGK
jgi:superkiller protein 3